MRLFNHSGISFVLCLCCAGCAALSREAIISQPLPDQVVYETAHYLIYSDVSHLVAQEAGNLMELALIEYSKIFAYSGSLPQKLKIHLYKNIDDYLNVSHSQGFTHGPTRGFYAPGEQGAIYTPYTGALPVNTLLHEGLHQFVDQALSFSPDLLGKQYLGLTTVPMWLNEGLAAYMESGRMEAERLVIGDVNQERLAHLKRLLGKTNPPAVTSVLSRPYTQSFNSGEYAVAWGIVYALISDPAQSKRLRDYISSCNRAFYDKPDKEFAQDFKRNGKLVSNVVRKFSAYIAKQSLSEFVRIIVGKSTTLTAWEHNWIKWIQKLFLNS